MRPRCWILVPQTAPISGRPTLSSGSILVQTVSEDSLAMPAELEGQKHQSSLTQFLPNQWHPFLWNEKKYSCIGWILLNTCFILPSQLFIFIWAMSKVLPFNSVTLNFYIYFTLVNLQTCRTQSVYFRSCSRTFLRTRSDYSYSWLCACTQQIGILETCTRGLIRVLILVLKTSFLHSYLSVRAWTQDSPPTPKIHHSFVCGKHAITLVCGKHIH